MRLSLLRAPKRPDDNADMHKHFISYALLPHKGQCTKIKQTHKISNYTKV